MSAEKQQVKTEKQKEAKRRGPYPSFCNADQIFGNTDTFRVTLIVFSRCLYSEGLRDAVCSLRQNTYSSTDSKSTMKLKGVRTTRG